MRVLHTDLTIEYFNDTESEMCGEYTDLPTPTIRINTAYERKTMARTKIHEYFHALYRLVHDPDEDLVTEEQAVRLFELGVEDLVQQNWKALEELRD